MSSLKTLNDFFTPLTTINFTKTKNRFLTYCMTPQLSHKSTSNLDYDISILFYIHSSAFTTGLPIKDETWERIVLTLFSRFSFIQVSLCRPKLAYAYA